MNASTTSRTLFAAALLAAPLAVAGAPQPIVLSHYGRLLDTADAPVSEPALALTFRLYDLDVASEREKLVWEATCSVTVTRGFYSVALGGGACAGNGLDEADFPVGESRFLQVSVGGTKLEPRMRVGVVPIAATALDARRLGGLESSAYATKEDLKTVSDSITAFDAGELTSGTLPGARLKGTYGEAVAFTNSANEFHGDGSNLVLPTATATTKGVLAPADFARFDGRLASVATAGEVLGDGTAGNPVRLSSAVPLLVNGRLPDSALPQTLAFAGGRLTVSGTVESTSGGFRFPDGSVQSTAAAGFLPRVTVTQNGAAAVNTWYLTNADTRVALTLPATCAVGDLVRVTGLGAGGWSIAPGQNQVFISLDGATGTSPVTSATGRDTIEVMCVAANARWQTTDGSQPRFFSPSCNTAPRTFSYTGAPAQLDVGGCTTITVKMWGAGGGGSTAVGGGGGYSTATLTVVPNERLEVLVGGGGLGASGRVGGGGGGRSAIRRGTTELVTAGGGGGAGSYGTSYTGGAGGGASGTTGGGQNVGAGGTQSAGGASATNNGGTPGAAFQGGLGGDGTNGTASGNGSAGGFGGGGAGGNGSSCYAGGGGGGGYFGGGGGAGDGCGGGSGGGGGGSGYVPSGGSTVSGAGASPGNASDAARGSAGSGGSANQPGGNGVVIITAG